MTVLEVPDDPKMLRETRLQRLINECDRHRPLGPDGKHGNLHTDTCGCGDKPPRIAEKDEESDWTPLWAQKGGDRRLYVERGEASGELYVTEVMVGVEEGWTKAITPEEADAMADALRAAAVAARAARAVKAERERLLEEREKACILLFGAHKLGPTWDGAPRCLHCGSTRVSFTTSTTMIAPDWTPS